MFEYFDFSKLFKILVDGLWLRTWDKVLITIQSGVTPIQGYLVIQIDCKKILK